MRLTHRLSAVVVIMLAAVCVGAAVAAFPRKADSDKKDRIEIERLHRLDVETTLSDKADELTKLWDKDAVRIQPGSPAENGKATIHSNDKRWETSSGRERSLCYNPEIQDLQIAGNWAYEWGYFSYKSAANGRTVTGRGKVLRVLKRQPDGSWKFARVMSFPETLESAAPVSHPCE